MVWGLVLFFSGGVRADIPEDPGQLLLDAFGSKCQSHGQMSQRVLNETSALKNVLERIKEDPHCQGLTYAYAAIVDVSEQLDFIDEGFENEQHRDMRVYIRRLEIQLAMTPEEDFLTSAALASEITQLKTKILELPYLKAQEDHRRRARAITKMQRYLHAINSDFNDQRLCFERHKTLPLQMAAHLVSIAGGFFDPVMGLALNVGGRLLGEFFKFIGDASISKKIKDYRDITLMAGVTCTLEALEQTFCDIEDQREYVSLREGYRENPLPDGGIPYEWKGFEILTKQYDILRAFLLAVEAGSPSQSDDQSARRAGFLKTEASFRATIENIEGSFAEARKDLARPESNTVARKQQILRQLVSLLSVLMHVENAFSKIMPSIEAMERLQLKLRVGTFSPPKRPNEENYSIVLSNLDSGNSPLTSMDAVTNVNIGAIEVAFNELAGEAGKQLDIERNDVLLVDTLGSYTSWTERTQGRHSPGTVIINLIDYMAHLEMTWIHAPDPWFAEPSLATRRDQIIEVQETKKMLEDALIVLKMSPEEVKENILKEREEEAL